MNRARTHDVATGRVEERQRSLWRTASALRPAAEGHVSELDAVPLDERRGAGDGWRRRAGYRTRRSPLRHRWSRSARQWSSLPTSTTTRRGTSVSRRSQSSSNFPATSVKRTCESPRDRRAGSRRRISMRWKKRPLVRSAVLGRLEHPPAVGGDEPSDSGHDPRGVGAGHRQDVAPLRLLGTPRLPVIRHGASRARILSRAGS